MNFIDIPTDCRSATSGSLTGDAQVYIRTATLNCDVQRSSPSGSWTFARTASAPMAIPMVAPVKVAGPMAARLGPTCVICRGRFIRLWRHAHPEEHYVAMAPS